ncbi:MAG: HAD family phosphatase [Bacteroidaceae bacterium]|nr:HAD family phosphatase [Bacteroidaceae bacterium]
MQLEMVKRLKAALFDFDGTLVDTEGQYTQFWGRMARTYRPDIPQLEFLIKGTTLTQIFDRYFPDPAWQAEITKGLDDWEAQMDYRPVAGAEAFVADLKQHGVKCAIVTSSNQKKMESVRNQRPEFLAMFDRILTSEDFERSKPDPDCYLKAAQQFNADISECVVFEDAFNGLEAGMASGIFSVGLTTNNPAEAIRDLCHAIIADFTEINYEKLIKLKPSV